MTATANNPSAFVACLILVDCDGEAPFLSCLEGTDEPELYPATYKAQVDAHWIEKELGVKCRIIPLLRHATPLGYTALNAALDKVEIARASKMRGASTAMAWCDFVPGVKNRGA